MDKNHSKQVVAQLALFSVAMAMVVGGTPQVSGERVAASASLQVYAAKKSLAQFIEHLSETIGDVEMQVSGQSKSAKLNQPHLAFFAQLNPPVGGIDGQVTKWWASSSQPCVVFGRILNLPPPAV